MPQIRYYDSKQETRSNGVISLSDVLSVDEAEPQVVPALKPGEAGFFFNVSTRLIESHLYIHAQKVSFLVKVQCF